MRSVSSDCSGANPRSRCGDRQIRFRRHRKKRHSPARPPSHSDEERRRRLFWPRTTARDDARSTQVLLENPRPKRNATPRPITRTRRSRRARCAGVRRRRARNLARKMAPAGSRSLTSSPRCACARRHLAENDGTAGTGTVPKPRRRTPRVAVFYVRDPFAGLVAAALGGGRLGFLDSLRGLFRGKKRANASTIRRGALPPRPTDVARQPLRRAPWGGLSPEAAIAPPSAAATELHPQPTIDSPELSLGPKPSLPPQTGTPSQGDSPPRRTNPTPSAAQGETRYQTALSVRGKTVGVLVAVDGELEGEVFRVPDGESRLGRSDGCEVQQPASIQQPSSRPER